ncbi:unnamed protein product [Rotaria magnacalcarata]|uniref:EF-hand domain-containing protein n=1 Tax=Rotaria magnacalcarata TaxID=392030 RepID=A0A819MKV8_9BILA|nr:unnamed protein product [Rotaria magnacalcarata]CAF4241519.1 unnamed protein product [Rotaria magnacalcarata]
MISWGESEKIIKKICLTWSQTEIAKLLSDADDEGDNKIVLDKFMEAINCLLEKDVDRNDSTLPLPMSKKSV